MTAPEWLEGWPEFARVAIRTGAAVFFVAEPEREHGPRRPKGSHPRRSRQAPKGARP